MRHFFTGPWIKGDLLQAWLEKHGIASVLEPAEPDGTVEPTPNGGAVADGPGPSRALSGYAAVLRSSLFWRSFLLIAGLVVACLLLMLQLEGRQLLLGIAVGFASATPQATPTLRLSTSPVPGICAHSAATASIARDTPSPSLPSTITALPARFAWVSVLPR